MEALRSLVERLSVSGYDVTQYRDQVQALTVWAFRRQNAHALAEERSDDSHQRAVGGKVAG
jgi:hypothetical protein